jgi:hypothetical protein
MKFNCPNYFVLLIIILALNCCISENKGVLDSQHRTYELAFEDSDDTLFISSKSWGLLGNHSTVYLSGYKKQDFIYDSIRDYRYISEDIIFLEMQKDSLYVFIGHASTVPTNFNSEVNILQIECNYDRFKYLEENYVELGIVKFTTYSSK